ncbi:hypothetical protein QG37_03000 [Candidozyma auris]|nr:hypothetical protein QG37_03000 [[Candida] auris]
MREADSNASITWTTGLVAAGFGDESESGMGVGN